MAVLTCPHLKRKLFYARVIKNLIKYRLALHVLPMKNDLFWYPIVRALVSDSTWVGI
jgi:hypothetical protein